MITKQQYFEALIIVTAHESEHGLFHPFLGSIPFSEYGQFQMWLEDNDWYMVNDTEFENIDDVPHSNRVSVKEIYLMYKESKKTKRVPTWDTGY